jgi:hypothetical protein
VGRRRARQTRLGDGTVDVEVEGRLLSRSLVCRLMLCPFVPTGSEMRRQDRRPRSAELTRLVGRSSMLEECTSHTASRAFIAPLRTP